MALAPRIPLIGLAGLMVFSVVAAGASRLWGHADEVSNAAPVHSRDLRFDDRSDGAVTVRDSAGTVVAVLLPGDDGFIRGTLRGLARDRRRMEANLDTPFRLTDWTDGRITLEDRSTGRHLELRAFGATNAAAFGRLLTAQVEESR
ncbi:photosynthetic complex assembly protein PuhC [Roseomonas sp. CCTCC AB2023176]|uniref:photosynthetic complex assembly protein PuhC n=1 Tax=Roseomonas sp. CCTCC AB2023176 TaxID=3342640 RepID=UPI0035D538AC